LKRCDRCDLIIGEGCSCRATGIRRPRRLYDEGYEWVKFEPDALLIHNSKTAHLPGACRHLTEADVKGTTWGWIPLPDAGQWERISETSPAKATEGNVKLIATKRCRDCASAVMSPVPRTG
jgi:hypothetical protein